MRGKCGNAGELMNEEGWGYNRIGLQWGAGGSMTMEPGMMDSARFI